MESDKLKLANSLLVEIESAKDCEDVKGSLALVEIITRDAKLLAELILEEDRKVS